MPERITLQPGWGEQAYLNDMLVDERNPSDNREINVPLLRKLLEHITAHPDEWDQQTWGRESQQSACGTALCVAGHAAHSLGHPLVWDKAANYVAHCLVDGEVRSIPSVATHALGLSNRDAAHLFSGGNTLADLWRLANEMTNGEIEIPADLEARSGT